MKRPSQLYLLYALSILGSGVGFMTQTLVSGFWSTAFSQDVTFYSVNLAFYFLSLGIGTRLSQRGGPPTLKKLLTLTLLLCLWCGLSISVLRWGIFRFNQATPVAIFVVCVAGTLAGGILPMTLALGQADRRMNLGRLFFFDYLAAIAFTLLFTFVLLIPLGYSRTALAVCGSGLVIVAVASWRAGALKAQSALAILASFALPWAVSLGAIRLATPPTEGPVQVVWAKQSHYQKIVLTESTASNNAVFPGIPQHTLYLDGFVQFSSGSEQLYHFCIANLPVTAAADQGHPVRKALVLGGGDGLVARNLIAFPNVDTVRMVELDPEMIRLARTDKHLRRYNLDSLRSPKVEVTVADAFTWVGSHTERYDLIVIDFPSPKNLALARLFSVEFYQRVARLLSPGGFLSIQAGPYFELGNDPSAISRITAGIAQAVEATGLSASVYFTPRDADAFVLATSDAHFSMDAFAKKVGVTAGGPLSGICAYDPQGRRPATELNTLNTLPLARDAVAWYRAVGGKSFFHFSDSFGIFLPD